MTSDPAPISVIGLGPMGQTMTRCLLKAGHEVVVWNRTPSRAEGVVAEAPVSRPPPARR
ncbi:NAD(P)-binding domain-containing protein [Saccharomonospora sp. CUA-673]|uniref:NAD(P)-binding domain-containing protein n=1 Tax=Saccharomonospora sp. CUA-673 TaxID=1904969 RepID=UPI000AC5EB4D